MHTSVSKVISNESFLLLMGGDIYLSGVLIAKFLFPGVLIQVGVVIWSFMALEKGVFKMLLKVCDVIEWHPFSFCIVF